MSETFDEPDGPDRVDDDDLLEEQEHRGYGEDEGERDESFPPDDE